MKRVRGTGILACESASHRLSYWKSYKATCTTNTTSFWRLQWCHSSLQYPKEITAISKTDSQDFSQRNPRDQNGEIHRVLRGLETWPRLKAQRNFTSESGWRSGISGDSLWEWEIDLNRVILWNLHQRSKTKKLAETVRNDTTRLPNKH